ncbi:hypothetical protein AC579_6754 [Pseudocercospora musae]|uniref:isoleucine--tRNA ligase n=1 Tax=Pseudocercospora musae TaxID=113226 RepID=A0A139I2S6_9PEZI|nr:hypothetical protein AC579_6754 [Pseudocercospora musae]KXT08862.1 hypothetical protein AC579_6754 [Pseudocercospora musae]
MSRQSNGAGGPQTTVDSHCGTGARTLHSRHDIQVQLQYLKNDPIYAKEKPLQITPNFADKDSKTNVRLAPGPFETIHDVRGQQEKFSLDGNGFRYVKAPTSFTNWSSQAAIGKDYLPELEVLLRREVEGCDEIMFYDARIRHSDDNGLRVEGLSYNPFAKQVHADNTERSVLAKIRNLTDMKADYLLSGRARIINIWRPIKHPVFDCGLAVVDAGKLQDGDILECDRYRADNNAYHDTMGVSKYRAGFDWHYCSEQDEEDVLLFKNYDSAAHVLAKTCLHTAFDLPPETVPTGSPTRESIEVRALIFTYPEQGRRPSIMEWPAQHPLAESLERGMLRRVDDEHSITDRLRTDIDEGNEVKDAVLLLRRQEIRRLEAVQRTMAQEREHFMSQIDIQTRQIASLEKVVQNLSRSLERGQPELVEQISRSSKELLGVQPGHEAAPLIVPEAQTIAAGEPGERSRLHEQIEALKAETQRWRYQALSKGSGVISESYQAAVDEAVRREREKDAFVISNLFICLLVTALRADGCAVAELPSNFHVALENNVDVCCLSMPAFAATRIIRAASHTDRQLFDKVQELARTKTSWSDTLALPKSQFPPRPSPEQIEQYRKRCADDLYAWQRQHRSATIADRNGNEKRNEFVLHDGPPYANGAVHVGHALNKILKDLILRSELARGKRVQYTPGWDCHGLPIELKALQQPKAPGAKTKDIKDAPEQEAKAATALSKQMSAADIRAAARKLAAETIEVQKKSFREWGVMGEWDRPYRTMDKTFELRQLGVFKDMAQKGLISRHHRPVYWSPSSRTALAEAELEYDDSHTCTAAFVKMPFVKLPDVLKANASIRSDTTSALIWTTTPWTLPANKAIAVGSDIKYSVISIVDESNLISGQDQLLVAKERIEHVLSHFPQGTRFEIIVDAIPGRELGGCCYNIFQDSLSPVFEAPFVTATSGTGVVHVAPGHGIDDWQACQAQGVGPAFAPVDHEGRYTVDAFPRTVDNVSPFLGLDAQTQGVTAVLDVLRSPLRSLLPEAVHASGSSLLLVAHKFTHKNPIDWRTKQPVITRATAQWFADISAVKDRALAALEPVHFIPESGKSRLASFIAGRSQWCISRQRAWGVPIPALYHVDTGEACITDESVDHIISVIQERGVDAWFSDAKADPAWLHPSLEPGKWIRGSDTMDVWFDSGTSWTSLGTKSDGHAPSDVYSEGTDQHRGWFQSSLLTAIAAQSPNEKPVAPFKTLTTHGFTLDGQGRKMSKSIGNVVSPDEIISGVLIQAPKAKNKCGKQKQAPPTKSQKGTLGPDVLRLWVASSDYTKDVSISQPVLQSVQQALQKYRVTFKFLLGVLHDYPVAKPRHDLLSELDFADRVVLQQLSVCSLTVFSAYSDYKFYACITEINRFINSDLSAFYFEIIKDRLYTGSMAARRHTQTILMAILQELCRMLGPATPHLIEEVWEWMPAPMKSTADSAKDSMHPLEQIWRSPFDAESFGVRTDEALSSSLALFRALSAAVKVAQEEARTARLLGSGLACRVEVSLPPCFDPANSKFSWLRQDELANLLVVSEAEVMPLSNATRSQEPNEEWRYEQAVELNFGGSSVRGTVAVLPPRAKKCPRCWKYTAEEEEVPCAPCREVLVDII